MNNSVVGEDIILPRSFGLQNVHPSVAKTNDIHLSGRGRRPRRPEVVSVTAAHPAIAKKRDLREPSPMGKGDRLRWMRCS